MGLTKWVEKKMHKMKLCDFAAVKCMWIIFGIILGAYISAFVKQFIWYFAGIFAVLFIWALYKIFKK